MNNSKTLLLRTAILLLFLVFKTTLISQNIKRDYHKIQTSIAIDVYDKLKIKQYGEKLAKEKFSFPSFKLLVNYSYYLKNIFGINAGLSYSIVPNVFYYEHPEKNPRTIYNEYLPNPNYHLEYLHNLISIPISIEKRFLLSKSYFLSSQIGYEFNYIINYPYLIIASHVTQNTKFFDMEIMNSTSRILHSVFFKIGFYKEFKRKNTLGVNFLLSYSPQLLGKGKYQFYNLPYESSGTFDWNINHIGLELVYSFIPIHKKDNIDFKFKKKKREKKIKFEWFPEAD